MSVEAVRYSVSTVQSLYYFFNNTSYISSGSNFYTNTTLKTRHSGLDIMLGEPHSLDRLSLPTLSIIQDPSPVEKDTFGSHYQERTISFHIDGYAGGNQSEEKNKLQRDLIREDVRYLLNDTDYIDLYAVDTDGKIDTSTTISNIEVINVNDTNLPATGPLAVDRFRFRINFDVNIVRD